MLVESQPSRKFTLVVFIFVVTTWLLIEAFIGPEIWQAVTIAIGSGYIVGNVAQRIGTK